MARVAHQRPPTSAEVGPAKRSDWPELVVGSGAARALTCAPVRRMVVPVTQAQREELIGRETELDSVGAFLDGLRADPAALVLDGEAGVGKTTLWLAASSWLGERGFRVLEARPVEAEAQMAFAALGDLLEDVLDEVLPASPGPQGDALRVALLRERPSRARPTSGRSGWASRRRCGPSAPRDPCWSRSTTSSGWTLRRRSCSPSPGGDCARSRCSCSRRAGSASRCRRRVGAGERLARRAAQPRRGSPAAARSAGSRPPRPVLRRVHEVAGGNPFFALELGRALARAARPRRRASRCRSQTGCASFSVTAWSRSRPHARGALGGSRTGLPDARCSRRGQRRAEVLRPAIDANVLVADGDASASRIRCWPRPPMRTWTRWRGARCTGASRSSSTTPSSGRATWRWPRRARRVRRDRARAGRRARPRARLHATAAELMERGERADRPGSLDDDRAATHGWPPAASASRPGDTARARRLLEEAVASAPTGRRRAEALARAGARAHVRRRPARRRRGLRRGVRRVGRGHRRPGGCRRDAELRR